MKLASYNIQYGFGADGRCDLQRVARVVADADIIALQEVERSWKRTGGDDQPALLDPVEEPLDDCFATGKGKGSIARQGRTSLSTSKHERPLRFEVVKSSPM